MNTQNRRFQVKLRDCLWILPAALAEAAHLLLRNRPLVVEQIHIQGVFRILSRPISILSSLVPFSLTEMLLILGTLAVFVFLVSGAVRLFRRFSGSSGRLPVRPAWKAVRLLLYGLSVIYLLFVLLHGLNYMRQPVAESFGLTARPRTTAELAAVTAELAAVASEARTDCLEDERGIFKLRDGIFKTLGQTADGYTAAASEWPLVAGPRTRPKGVLLSHYWSYTWITGLYFPILVEANVNIDQPDYAIPDTAGHELAHTRGFAREDEAGFISFLTGLYNPNADYRYSVLANAYVRCANALYAQSVDDYDQVARLVSEGMSRDLADNSRYWQQFAGPVSEVSEQINDSYLKANLQTDGVRSYGRMIDLVLAYHEYEGGHF